MAALLVLASNTGNTSTFIDFLQQNSDVEVEVCRDFKASPINYDRIILGTYTWANGKIPKRMKDYLIDNRHNFHNKKVFIFGSGNSVYPRFCAAVDGVQKIVTDCGASVIGTFKFEQRFDENQFSQKEINNLIETIREWGQ